MRQNRAVTFGSGAVIGVLSGLIGLGGAEFRLPLLIKTCGFAALDAVILNKFISLVVVASALPFRAGTVPLPSLIEHWDVILNLLAGSILGAWFGAGWAIKLKTETFYKIIAVLLIFIALILLLSHNVEYPIVSSLSGHTHIIAGVTAGLIIGVVAALLGVAGGELLIPTLIMLFGADIKLCRKLISSGQSTDYANQFWSLQFRPELSVMGKNRNFVLLMAAGSLLGAFFGGQLLGIIPESVLLPFLSLILLISAIKVWRHQ